MEVPLQPLARIRPNIWAINLASIPLTVACAVGFVLLVLVLPHRHPGGEFSIVWFLPGIAIAFSLHELMHALVAMWRAKLPLSAFKFGFNPKILIFYCHCRRPVDLATYQAVALAPLVVLGPISVLLVVLYPAIWLALTAAVHLSGCIGDVWIFTMLRKYASNFLVMDHPTEAGCDLFAPEVHVGALDDAINK